MHIGFILDGNRRWASSRGLPKFMGHNKGLENLEKIIEVCTQENIPCVSAWVIAKKNLEERSPEEIGHLFDLIRKNIERLLKKLIENGYIFDTIGDLSLLPKDIADMLNRVKEESKINSEKTFILAIGYGGQDETVRGVKAWARAHEQAIKEGRLEEALAALNEPHFNEYLDSGKFPPPDLIIRTGGDVRHSGYFLYACEYSEYYFTKTFWPDFDEAELHTALDTLKGAKRNFGK